MKGIRDAGLNEGTCAPGVSTRDLPVLSRRDALETLRKTISLAGSELVLLTGEPGAGKTWLWRRLVQDLPTNWRWLSLDMSEALDALEFLRLIGHGLGITTADRLGVARLALARALQDESSDGRSWLLVIENAQNTPQEIWNEIHALIHGMEASEGFAALVLVGPTELARLLAARRLTALATRLGAHVHLLPLDLDETRELVQYHDDLGTPDRATLEELHRDAWGNPRRLLQFLRKRSRTISAPAITSQPATLRRLPEPLAQPVGATSAVIAEPASRAVFAADRGVQVSPQESERSSGEARSPVAAPLVPSRPPLRVEEGLIEVGWGGSLEAESAASAGDTVAPTVVPASAGDEGELPSEEMIEDHYAALQAWTEWARNRGRVSSSSAAAAGVQPDRVQPQGTAGGAVEDEGDSAEAFLSPGIRAESQHEHAPNSRLFSRLRQSK